MTYALTLGNFSIQTWSHFSKNSILKSIRDYAQNFPHIHSIPYIANPCMLFKILKNTKFPYYRVEVYGFSYNLTTLARGLTVPQLEKLI